MNLTKIKNNLEKLGYTVSCFETAAQGAEYLEHNIKGQTVGVGGTITAQQMGLYEKLIKHNTVYWHWYAPEGVSMDEMLQKAGNTDIYLSSVNSIAETGEMINIDGTCNRVASTLYGHKKVYFLIGSNKIAPDYETALHRARNISAPLNARRLKKHTPCATGDLKCHNCNSPERICKALTVLWEMPKGCDYEIILMDEELGY